MMQPGVNTRRLDYKCCNELTIKLAETRDTSVMTRPPVFGYNRQCYSSWVLSLDWIILAELFAMIALRPYDNE